MAGSKAFWDSSCTQGIADNIREELWGYFALSGLLFLNIGIVLVVYALKRATSYPLVMEVIGLGLIILGVITTLASWYVHRQHRRKKPLCSCACFCCYQVPSVSLDDARLASSKGDVNEKDSSPKLAQAWVTKKGESAPEHTIKMFTTPEFQTYAEYVKKDTAGVEINGTHKVRFESTRYSKHVHPQPPGTAIQPTKFVNAVYKKHGLVASPPVMLASPILLKLSR